MCVFESIPSDTARNAYLGNPYAPTFNLQQRDGEEEKRLCRELIESQDLSEYDVLDVIVWEKH